MPSFGGFNIGALLDRKYRVQEQEAAARMLDARSGATLRQAQGGLYAAQTGQVPLDGTAQRAFMGAQTQGLQNVNGAFGENNALDNEGQRVLIEGNRITNQFLPRRLQSEIGLTRAQTGNTAANMRATNYGVDDAISQVNANGARTMGGAYGGPTARTYNPNPLAPRTIDVGEELARRIREYTRGGLTPP